MPQHLVGSFVPEVRKMEQVMDRIVHTYNPGPWETEARGLLKIPSQSGRAK